MFTFKDLDRMGRLELLKEQKEAAQHWRDCHRVQGLLIAFGKGAKDIIQAYSMMGVETEAIKAWERVKLHGETTMRKLHNHMEKLDKYLSYIDARLADGTKWYTAREIAEMQARDEGAPYVDYPPETSGM